jgi:hypothetical protein
MIPLHLSYSTAVKSEPFSATKTKSSPHLPVPDLIWRLHRKMIDPETDSATAKRAKASLLSLITKADASLDMLIPSLTAFANRSRAEALL